MPPVNIYVIGAQCTGKTTLVNALQKHFSTKRYQRFATDCSTGGETASCISAPGCIKETARTVFQTFNFNADVFRNSPVETLIIQKLIMDAQHAAEKNVSQTCDFYISDRSIIDPTVYAWQYVGPKEAVDLRSSPEFVEMREVMKASLVVVCQGDFSRFKKDSVRLEPDSDEEWKKTQTLFVKSLIGEGPADWIEQPSKGDELGDGEQETLVKISSFPNTLLLPASTFYDTKGRVDLVMDHWENLLAF